MRPEGGRPGLTPPLSISTTGVPQAVTLSPNARARVLRALVHRQTDIEGRKGRQRPEPAGD